MTESFRYIVSALYFASLVKYALYGKYPKGSLICTPNNLFPLGNNSIDKQSSTSKVSTESIDNI